MTYYEEKLKQITSDKYQSKAFLSNKSTVVLAGPGSGKTTVLTLKMKRLLDNYIASSRGLACMTFSNEAAKEFTERLSKVGIKKNSNIFLGTVHSFSLKEVILPFGELYNKEISFPIELISKKEKAQLISDIKVELEQELDINLQNVKNNDIDALRTYGIKGISKVVCNMDCNTKIIADRYENKLQEIKKVDYTSLIKYATELVQDNEYIRKCLEAKFPWILVDEYQDLGRPIHEMILTLMRTTKIKFFIVGDCDQSIYSFQGAKPDYLEELYNLPNVEAITLKNNYRSKGKIIEGSSLVLNINRNYVAKNTSGQDAEYFFYNCKVGINDQFNAIAKYIIPKCIKEGIKLDEIAILVSNNKQAEDLGSILAQYNINYYISRHKFERTDLVIWLEDISKWVINKREYSFDKLFFYWKSLLLKMNLYNDINEMYYKKRLFKIFEDSYKYKDCMEKWLSFIINKLEIYAKLNILNDVDEINNLNILIQECKDGALSNLSIEKLASIGKPLNQVTITTRHSSKGLEFDVVILVGMEQDNFPKYRARNDADIMNEERRICFVCVSRARKVCYLLKSEQEWKVNRYYPNGKLYSKTPSIFWDELFSRFGNNSNFVDVSYD